MAIHPMIEKVLKNQKLKDIQKGVLIAYMRGLLTEEQATRQLGLNDVDSLIKMMQDAGLGVWNPKKKKVKSSAAQGSLVDGYVNFWSQHNMDE
ncbi:MAG: hypothetical protein U1E36_02840 [Rickettsiales bacterium]